jgi:hypothetical protein
LEGAFWSTEHPEGTQVSDIGYDDSEKGKKKSQMFMQEVLNLVESEDAAEHLNMFHKNILVCDFALLLHSMLVCAARGGDSAKKLLK